MLDVGVDRPIGRTIFYLNNLNGGGAERVIVKVANELHAKGLDVCLVLAKKEGAYISEVDSSIDIINLNCQFKMLALFKLIAYIRATDPAVLFSTLTGANVIALLAAKLSKKNIRTIVREGNTPSMERSYLGVKTSVLMFFAKRLYSSANAVVCVSCDSRDDFLATFPAVSSDRVTVIYNPVVDESFYSMLDRGPEKSLPWAKDEFIFLAVGRLSKQKNFTLLMRSFKAVRDRHPCKLVILGEGELRGALEKEAIDLGIRHDVWMPGFIKNPFPYMRKCGAFVLSSSWEGLPNVLIQAMASGAKIISTNCPSGPREILNNGLYGILVAPNDERELTEEMAKVMLECNVESVEGPSLDEKIERFKVAKVVDEYLAIICAERETVA